MGLRIVGAFEVANTVDARGTKSWLKASDTLARFDRLFECLLGGEISVRVHLLLLVERTVRGRICPYMNINPSRDSTQGVWNKSPDRG